MSGGGWMDFSKALKRIDAYLEFLKNLIPTLRAEQDLLSEVNLTAKHLEELEMYVDKLKAYQEKLRNRIVEVAFVGLEKSGKSTLINAILKSDFLPTAKERTTYTVTTVKYGSTPKIEIYFYDEEEFLNEVYRPRLKDIQYPEYQYQTLNTVSLDDLKKHFEKLETSNRNLYDTYRDTSGRDLEEIISGKDIIVDILRQYGKKRRIIDDDIDRYKEFITDKFKSRTVKEIRIYSPVLESMKDLIIYDLPGFDSPTYIHSKFTIDKMKIADAVVFVREAEYPSLRRLEVQVITQTKEEDGLELKEKIFFFLNKVDKIETRKDLDSNLEKFMSELKKYEIELPEKRIIIGSSVAKLQRLKMFEGNFAIEGLKRLNIEDDGVDILVSRIKDYYENERADHLVRRLNSLFSRIEEFIEKIRQVLIELKYEAFDDELEINLEKERTRIKRSIINKIEEYHSELKEELKQNFIISHSMKENILNELVFEKIFSDNDLNNIRKRVESKSSTFEERPEEYNKEIRVKLFEFLNKKFEDIVRGNIEFYLDKVKNNIIKIFCDELQRDEFRKDEILRIIEKEYLMKSLNIEFNYDKFGIDILVERFAGDIIQLLRNPLGSQDREGKIQQIENELFSLLAYSDSFDPDEPLREHPLFIQLRYHLNVGKFELYKTELEKLLSGTNLDVNSKQILRVLNLLLKATNANDILKLLTESLSKKPHDRVDWEYIINFILNRIRTDIDISSIKSKSYSEVNNEIKTDIQLLSYILTNIVIRAINPERALNNRITRYIQIIIEDLQDESGKFNELFRKNIDIFLPELRNEKIRRLTKLKRLESVREFIENLDTKIREV